VLTNGACGISDASVVRVDFMSEGDHFSIRRTLDRGRIIKGVLAFLLEYIAIRLLDYISGMFLVFSMFSVEAVWGIIGVLCLVLGIVLIVDSVKPSLLRSLKFKGSRKPKFSLTEGEEAVIGRLSINMTDVSAFSCNSSSSTTHDGRLMEDVRGTLLAGEILYDYYGRYDVLGGTILKIEHGKKYGVLPSS